MEISRRYEYVEMIDEIEGEKLIRFRIPDVIVGGGLAFTEFWIPNDQVPADLASGAAVRIYEDWNPTTKGLTFARFEVES